MTYGYNARHGYCAPRTSALAHQRVRKQTPQSVAQWLLPFSHTVRPHASGGRASLDPRLGLRGSPSARGAFVDPLHFWRQPCAERHAGAGRVKSLVMACYGLLALKFSGLFRLAEDACACTYPPHHQRRLSTTWCVLEIRHVELKYV